VSAPRTEPKPRRRLYAAAAVVVLLVAGMVAWRARGSARPTTSAGARTSLLRREVRAPAGTRIRVQVLNATKTRGLARRATFFLRDRGFDVVEVGTTAEGSDSVVVLDRSGHPEWARLVAQALGGARVEARPDSSR
jgi:hypothetical protein